MCSFQCVNLAFVYLTTPPKQSDFLSYTQQHNAHSPDARKEIMQSRKALHCIGAPAVRSALTLRYFCFELEFFFIIPRCFTYRTCAAISNYSRWVVAKKTKVVPAKYRGGRLLIRNRSTKTLIIAVAFLNK